jgi:hypothetical protein
MRKLIYTLGLAFALIAGTGKAYSQEEDLHKFVCKSRESFVDAQIAAYNYWNLVEDNPEYKDRLNDIKRNKSQAKTDLEKNIKRYEDGCGEVAIKKNDPGGLEVSFKKKTY